MRSVIHRESSFWGRTSVVIISGGYALAMVTVMDTDKSVAIIHDLRVHRSRRRKGLGDTILAESCKEATRMGAKTVRLSVEPGTWQVKWYARKGFEETVVIEYEGHDCLVMEKENPS